MRYNFTLIATLVVAVMSSLTAQDSRFIDPIYEVGAPTVDTFGQNVDVLLLAQVQAGQATSPVRQLEMDVYQPIGDDDLSLRPVVVVFHTGNFLPRYVNQGLFGTRADSSVIQIVSEVTKRGFVGISADYRLGWNPRGDEAVRTKTILEAAYRGGQDAHTLARYLRKSVAEDGNPYRIDTSRIVFWGLGTGGYVTLTHAYLDNIQEVLNDERFYDAMDNPYVDVSINADPQGTLPAEFAPMIPSNIPNHTAYSSDIAMSVNGNGALGDIDWIEGKDHEPIMLGFHNPGDIFAPFSFGDVVVPTTNDIVIGCVGGTEQIIEVSNGLDNQASIESANATDLPAFYGSLAAAINVRNAAYQETVITPESLPACEFQTVNPTYKLSHDNMYPFVGQGIGTPYNWVDPVAVRAEIAAFNAAGGMLNADVTLGGEMATNPNAFNAAGAKLVIDTMINFFLPRAYVGLELETLVSVDDLISNTSVGMEVFPNPASNGFTVRTDETHPIRSLRLMDMNGRVVANVTDIDAASRFVRRGNLPRGVYLLQIQLDEGTTARKLILD